MSSTSPPLPRSRQGETSPCPTMMSYVIYVSSFSPPNFSKFSPQPNHGERAQPISPVTDVAVVLLLFWRVQKSTNPEILSFCCRLIPANIYDNFINYFPEVVFDRLHRPPRLAASRPLFDTDAIRSCR